MLTILVGMATWEREIMLERQREGIAKAKAGGTTWQLQWTVTNARPCLAAISTAVSTSPAITRGAPSAPWSTKAGSPSHMPDLR
jgi:hypothetical protein